MSYQSDRDQFVARVTQEGLHWRQAQTLLRCATTLQRLAELGCSSEAADRDRVPCPQTPCLCDLSDGEHTDVPRIRIKDWNCERRAEAALPAGWALLTQGDPRGAVLRIIPPSYKERNQGRDQFNLEGIAVPARDSGLRF